MKTVLITGANRGLGLGMVKYLTKQKKAEKIFATCRNASEVCNVKQLLTNWCHCHLKFKYRIEYVNLMVFRRLPNN